jgi:hypothetical protein
MFQAFKEAGIKGPGLREAVKSAGFDADQVFSLAHPDAKRPGPGTSQPGTSKINAATLQTLQNILSKYDLSNMDSDQESDLFSNLKESGLLKTTSLIDLGA